MMRVIHFEKKKKGELTGSVPLERTAPSLNRNLDKEFSFRFQAHVKKKEISFLIFLK